MTLTIQLSPEKERRLREIAHRQGRPVEEVASVALDEWMQDHVAPDTRPLENTWLTGEQFAIEKQRLREAGCSGTSPEYQRLLQRLADRNAYIWDRHGPELMNRFPGKWAAIALNGEYVIADSEVEALRRARERFGAGNACVSRLTSDRGIHRLRPRIADG